MRVVHKFPLELTDKDQRHYRIGNDTKIVHVGGQQGLPTLWAEVESGDMASDVALFRVFGTGHDIPPGYVHVGTCFLDIFVWHVYRWSP